MNFLNQHITKYSTSALLGLGFILMLAHPLTHIHYESDSDTTSDHAPHQTHTDIEDCLECILTFSFSLDNPLDISSPVLSIAQYVIRATNQHIDHPFLLSGFTLRGPPFLLV